MKISSENNLAPRSVDHLVLPVAEVEVARARYEALGFTVAPTGVHPFGTENCCVFFADGTFLEPLGIAHRETCEAKALKGHTFVRNDQSYRFRRGVEGFSHMVLKSGDARADHKAFQKRGISGGKMVKFGRSFATPDGQKGRVSFHLAFAADPRSPDADFFTCQVLDPPKVDRSALQAHANGVVGLRKILMSETNPTDFQYFFQDYLNQREMEADSFGMSFAADNCEITVLTPDGLRAFYGIEASGTERGLLFEAAVLDVRDISVLTRHFDAQGVAYSQHRGTIVVPPATGQGTTLIFGKPQ